MNPEQEKEQLKNHLLEYIESKTEKSKGQNQYICPICGSGTHSGAQSTGALTYYKDTQTWYCFVCHKSGDLYSLIGEVEGLQSFPEQLQRARELYGDNISLSAQKSPTKKEVVKTSAPAPDPEFKEKCLNYIEKCRKNVNKTEYLHNRGFSDEIIKKFKLGYDESQKLIVIPYGTDSFYCICRATEKKYYKKPPVKKAGSEPIFYQEFLYSDKPCFVTEGAFDALSIIQAIDDTEEASGTCNAIALNGTGNHDKLISLYESENPPTAPLIICLDNDNAGQTNGEKLYNKLQEKGINCIKAEFNYNEYKAPEGNELKDPNNLLQADKELFGAEILNNILRAEETKEEIVKTAEEEKEKYEEESGLYRVLNLFEELKKNTEAIDTGFIELNRILDGGLYAGLYTIGAVSSMGKTTFVLQMIDQIAKTGKDILFVSLEMSATELISKSLSRMTYEIALEEGLPKSVPKTVRGIMSLNRYQYYTQEESNTITKAQKKYAEYGKHIIFKEGIGDIGVKDIKEMIEKHKRITGNTPIVCIDYLQILAPYNERTSDKQNTDTAIRELKRLSRDYGIPIIAISSLNRDNYSKEISMSAFKESGAIEYGSDVLIGLQPYIEKDDRGKPIENDFNVLVDKTKQSPIRAMELVILKQRNGQTGLKAKYEYNPMFNYFNEESKFIEVTKYDKNDPLKTEIIGGKVK